MTPSPISDANIGWHQSMFTYRSKIRDLVAKMFAVLPKLLPANAAAANDYINTMYKPVMTLQASVNECYYNEGLQTRFNLYVDKEEARLKASLEAVQYDIDALDTLALVTGPGRIERVRLNFRAEEDFANHFPSFQYLLPLIYLLLKRHFEIFRICQKHVTHSDELWDAADTVLWIGDAVDDRVSMLKCEFAVDSRHSFVLNSIFSVICPTKTR